MRNRFFDVCGRAAHIKKSNPQNFLDGDKLQKGDDTMFKATALFTKIVLAALVAAVCLAVLPASAASAAALDDPANPPAGQTLELTRLEKIWASQQAVYQRQDRRLARAEMFIARIQTLIDKANEKGWDTSEVQSALNGFAAVIPAAQAAHAPGAAIIASHAGFNDAGKVTDRTTAIQTSKALGQVLKDTHTALNGTGRALFKALKAFRDAHPHNQLDTVPFDGEG
jgi:hypothetical protein